MKYKIRKSIYIVLLGAFVQCNNNEEPAFKLDLSAQAGKIYSYSFFHASTSRFLQQTKSDTVKLEIDIEVGKSQAHLYKVKIVFRNLEKNQQVPSMRAKGGSLSIRKIRDLKSELASKYDFIFRALKGKEITVLINEKGIVERVNGADELISKIALELKEDKRLVGPIVHDYASEDAIKDHLNLLFSAVPNKAVKAGDNWGNDITLLTKAPININTLYTLKEMKGDSTYLSIESKILGGTPGNFYMKGNQSGLAIINYQTGLPYFYETVGNTTTTTTNYDVTQNDHWIIILKERK